MPNLLSSKLAIGGFLLVIWQLAFIANCLAASDPGINESDQNAVPALLADTGDEIKTVVVSVNSARRSSLRNAALVSNIINGLPPTTRFLILTNDRQAFASVNQNWPERIQFIELPTSNPITMWTQDPFLVLENPSVQLPQSSAQPMLLASKTFERSGDDQMARHIAEVRDYELQTSDLFFEGGNIVSDNEFILIGANTIHYNAVQLNKSQTDVVLDFQRELGRPVLVIGPYPQPIAHIDMMITPLGQGRMLVADTEAGAGIAEKALQQDPQSVEAFERSCEQQFFGHPSITEIHKQDGTAIRAPEVVGKTRQMIEISRDIGKILDGIALSMESYGYQVARVPFLFGGPENVEIRGEISTQAAYPMLTYNNVLISGKDVYLPRYGWAVMDDAAQAAWHDLGFETHSIDGLTISAMYGGALRCSVKVLERGQ